MTKRFFEKSDRIESLSESDMNEFLRKEKLLGKIESSRITDFYNHLSCLSSGEDVKINDIIDYNHFNCKTQEDIDKINSLRDMEKDYLSNINKDILSSSRMLKAAIALSLQFEKMMNGGESVKPEDLNEYLRNIFQYQENPPDDTTASFGDIIEMDFLFLKYIALLSKKKAFFKNTGKLVRSDNGNIQKYSSMNSFDEVYNIDIKQLILPNYKEKLAQKDVYVRTKFNKVEMGQNIIIIVDDSGSMNTPEKKAMLGAALTLKINNASDAHNIYVGTFETELFGFKKIEKGTKFEELRSFIFLNKGGTDVNGCIMETIHQIKSRTLKKRGGGHYDLNDDSFEIMVINDGQDKVDTRYHPSIKTHALCLKQSNSDLKNICHRSGGTYFYIEGDRNES